MSLHEVVIVAAKRTPIGALLGSLSTCSAPELGAIAHQAALKQAGIAATEIDEVIYGCVLQAGIGQAPARQSAIKAGVPYGSGATTINKMCGSGMKALMLGHDLIRTETAHVVLAGGMESMSNAPYLLTKARSGYRLGHGELKDHLFFDGLEDAYHPGQLMGCFAEATAKHLDISREQQDDYAALSMTRALKAMSSACFAEEIASVTVSTKQGKIVVSRDESPHPEKLEKIRRLNPAFQSDGTVTAANSSSISDGAASLILMSRAHAKQFGIQALARIVAHASHAQAPEWFTTAPIDAISKVLKKASWRLDEVDLFEINEAFAVVVIAAMRQLELHSDRVNIHGGACALGHPIGASGARILVTLIHALKQEQKKRGVAALCIGGGEATAMAIELI